MKTNSKELIPGGVVNDEYFMREALKEAHLAARAGEVPIGAVLVAEGKIIARGHNRPIQAHDPTAHAEIETLRKGALTLGNYRLAGCRLYVTMEPCLMCSGALLHARIDELIIGTVDEKSGAICSRAEILNLPWINHHIEVRVGVLEEPCRRILQSFFQERRQAHKRKKLPV